jgi:hypothetical protein
MLEKNISLRRRLARSCSQHARSLGCWDAVQRSALKKFTRFFPGPRLSEFIRGKVFGFLDHPMNGRSSTETAG